MSSYLKPIETLGSKEICFKVALQNTFNNISGFQVGATRYN
jgi:hypothetical protein